jgi:hypothetical protein
MRSSNGERELTKDVHRIGREGEIVSESSVGYVYKYADVNGTLLPRDQWIPATNDTVYDSGSFKHLRVFLLNAR